MLVGVMAGEAYDEATCRLSPGETLILMTDGILDCRNAEGEFLGIEGLQNFAREIPDNSSVQEQAASLLEKARIYSRAQLNDDVCLLLARRAA